MKKLVTLTTLLPGAALAHGGHADVTGPAHDAIHLGPLLGAVAVVVVILLVARERRS